MKRNWPACLHISIQSGSCQAISLLIEAVHSTKECGPSTEYSGALPVNLAILHSAAEFFEVTFTDSTASSLCSWIGHSIELHKALHSSSPGSNRKDTRTRLLECIDAGVVYHKNGVIGLLRYAAALASGEEAHLCSSNILGQIWTLRTALENLPVDLILMSLRIL